jgi:hypothetical protein
MIVKGACIPQVARLTVVASSSNMRASSSQGYPYTRIRNLLTIECTKRKTKHRGNRQPEIGDVTLEFDIENSSTKSFGH